LDLRADESIIINLYKKGKTIFEVCSILDIAQSRVTTVLKKVGGARRKGIPLKEDYDGVSLQEIISWRQDENMSLQQIGNKLGISRERVRQVLHRFGMDGASHYKQINNRIVELLQEGLSPEEIAKNLSCSIFRVKNLRAKAGVDLSKYPQLKDKAWLTEQYIDKHLSEETIGKSLGCSYMTVHRWVLNYGLKRPDRVKPFPIHHPELWDKGWITEQKKQGKSASNIAREVGCSYGAALKAWHRTDWEPPIKRYCITKEWLVERISHGKTVMEICDEIGCNYLTILKKIHKFRLKAYYEKSVRR
jgi:DNA-binding CsgD family transcriptional regulator